jgi:intracellular sulfur oxidation DsrE/DsrF family protein
MNLPVARLFPQRPRASTTRWRMSVSGPALATLAFCIAVFPAHAASPEAPGVITVEVKKNIRVVYDIKTDEVEAGVGKALYYLRGLFAAYERQGVAPGKIHLSAVLHGPTVKWLLNDEAYQKHVGDPFAVNLNQQVVEELVKLGASIEACNATMKARGWTPKDLLPGVRVVHDAYTRMIDLQQRGYAYIRF